MSKRSVSETIQHNARFFTYLDNNIRHMKNYQDLREFLQEDYPEVYEEWLSEISQAD